MNLLTSSWDTGFAPLFEGPRFSLPVLWVVEEAGFYVFSLLGFPGVFLATGQGFGVSVLNFRTILKHLRSHQARHYLALLPCNSEAF